MKSLLLIASSVLLMVVGCKQPGETTSTSTSTGSQPAAPAVQKRPAQTVRVTISLKNNKVVADPDPAPQQPPALFHGDTVEWTTADGNLTIRLMDSDDDAGQFKKQKNHEPENQVQCNGKKCTLKIKQHNHIEILSYKYVAEINCPGKDCQVSDPDLEVSGACCSDLGFPPPRH